MISRPTHANITEWPASTTWFGDDGILYSISKKTSKLSVEETKKKLDEFKTFIGDKKICMMVDVTNSSELPRETRDYAAEQLPKVVKAMALVSSSPVGKMLANVFLTLKTPPYPTKMFTDEKAAKEWLKQYL